ncbi:ATP-dependent nuclease [Pseudomonas aeruginosa]|uniref:ATP-dependent nuclease n=1 Tax=Pseudomonas aeruginosa TaxID=287 RepID=UPI0026F33141|nr:AAA family ATPase [Pseudomonas aeruginosa]
MKLVSLSINNYRSITRAHKIPLSQFSVLVGKNNEGKSNVLHALNLALEIIKQYPARMMRKQGQVGGRENYRTVLRRAGFDWEKDYPISLQEKVRARPCILRLEFSLDEQEILDFHESIGSKLNGTLPIEILISNEFSYDLRVVKSGKGAATLARRSNAICAFVAERLVYNYIPAVRTAGEALKVVEEMVSHELYSLEEMPAYTQALEQIRMLQEPVLERISELITIPLREFIPQILSATVTISNEARRRALTKCDIVIDDGIKTSIERKGDGVKSLAAISLLRGLEDEAGFKILALEEPESHLHPDAIHRLREVIHDLSLKHQVIVTTHCPLFVNRTNVGSNIIIDQNSARAVRSIEEIRGVLGVRASDNLQHARLVLLVEGETDVVSLSAILTESSGVLAKAIKDGLLVIKSMDGVSKLAFHTSHYKSSMCDVHVYCDSDQAGKAAVQKLLDNGELSSKEVHMATCPGMNESEFEDCLSEEAYSDIIFNNYGVDLSGNKEFRRRRGKFSERLEGAFKISGKLFTRTILTQIKIDISHHVEESGVLLLNERRGTSVDALWKALEIRVRNYR